MSQINSRDWALSCFPQNLTVEAFHEKLLIFFISLNSNRLADESPFVSFVSASFLKSFFEIRIKVVKTVSKCNSAILPTKRLALWHLR